MARFTKKPVTIEAVRVKDLLRDSKVPWVELPKWVRQAFDRGELLIGVDRVVLTTPQGRVKAARRDWLVQDGLSAVSAAKADDFKEAYVAVDARAIEEEFEVPKEPGPKDPKVPVDPEPDPPIDTIPVDPIPDPVPVDPIPVEPDPPVDPKPIDVPVEPVPIDPVLETPVDDGDTL